MVIMLTGEWVEGLQIPGIGPSTPLPAQCHGGMSISRLAHYVIRMDDAERREGQAREQFEAGRLIVRSRMQWAAAARSALAPSRLSRRRPARLV